MCRNLMWAWKKLVQPIGYTKTGKIKILGKQKWKVTFDCSVKNNPNLPEYKNQGPYLLSHIKIPCGQCIDCRLQRSRNWADRCMLEQKQWENNYFITLTYDEEHIHKKQGVDVETGEIREVNTLEDKDLQLFMKNLRTTWERKYNHKNIRFFACGEYGDKKLRPHYHIIMFNLPIYDLKYSHQSHKNKPIYYSEEIEKIWGRGITTVQEVTWETCAYTARYIMKKQTGPGAKDYYETIGREPEFVRMSRRPGIAREYYEKNKEQIYETDEIFIKTKKGINRTKPARYYDKLYDIENPIEMAKIKKQREKTAENKIKEKLKSTDMKYLEMITKEEQNKDEKLKALKRNI